MASLMREQNVNITKLTYVYNWRCDRKSVLFGVHWYSEGVLHTTNATRGQCQSLQSVAPWLALALISATVGTSVFPKTSASIHLRDHAASEGNLFLSTETCLLLNLVFILWTSDSAEHFHEYQLHRSFPAKCGQRLKNSMRHNIVS